jgi:hypothetical protein
MTCCYFPIACLAAPVPGLLSEDSFIPDKNHKLKGNLSFMDSNIHANNLFAFPLRD